VNRFGTKLDTAVALRELSTLLSSLFYRYGESPFWREKSKEFPVISIYFSGTDLAVLREVFYLLIKDPFFVRIQKRWMISITIGIAP
jgi:hypothetical protein